MTDTYDSPWKEMLEEYFAEFLAFFFPQVHADIDWSRGYESLDSELQQVVRDAELGKRLADKLMRVWLTSGDELIILIHVEVQGEAEEEFPLRMFTYNYRIFDRYGREVVSLAVLGDDSATWRPDRFGYGRWGFEMSMRFPVVKLRDYSERWAELEASTNPFATVVMAHLKTRSTRGDAEDRLQWKINLVRRLYQGGYERQDVLELLRFIDWVLALPAELEEKFRDEVKTIEEGTNVRYVTSFERLSREEGLEQGIQQGVERGLQQGVREGQVAVLRRLVSRRFGECPDWVEGRLQGASDEELLGWIDRVLDAESVVEVFRE